MRAMFNLDHVTDVSLVEVSFPSGKLICRSIYWIRLKGTLLVELIR